MDAPACPGCHEAHLPDACPHCRGRLVETGTAEQFPTEIPRAPLIRKFRVHVGRCGTCGKRTQGRHPLPTSDAPGAAATRLEPDYHPILDEVRRSEQVAADETGWRVGGRSARPRAWVGDRATAYAIDSKHSAEVLGRVIGAGGSGVLSHDGFASYDRFEGAIRQQCVARARELLTAATRGAVRFPRQVLALFTEAIHWRNGTPRGVRTVDQLEGQREAFDDRLLDLVSRPRAVPEYAARARHLWNHFEPWFAFVFDPRIEPTNGRAEQAIRPAVVNRKVWGGNRTPGARRRRACRCPCWRRCRRHAHSAVDHVSRTLRWFGNRALPRPVLLRRESSTGSVACTALWRPGWLHFTAGRSWLPSSRLTRAFPSGTRTCLWSRSPRQCGVRRARATR